MSSKLYRRAGFSVPRKSRLDVRVIAQKFLAKIAHEGWQVTPFPAVQLVEYWGSSTELGHPNVDFFSDEELPGRDAEYLPHRNLFRFRESVYLRAADGDPQAIETFTHEISHALLDHPTPAFMRSYDAKKYVNVVPEEDSEHQADWCMDELNMPYDQIQTKDSYGDLMNRFGVNRESAIRRLHNLAREKSRKGIR